MKSKDDDRLCEMHAIVCGRVQGVFFRASTYEIAQEIGVKGTVKNLPNGTVEIFAQGKLSQLNELIGKLKSAKKPAVVESIETEFSVPQKQYQDFQIVY